MLQRLALSYGPASAREATLALFALDTRLAAIVRSASEPMLAQVRLAWWREMFARPVSQWPSGEPLLGLLAQWPDDTSALAALVDGWEEMIVEGELAAQSVSRLAQARGEAFAALARLLGKEGAADTALRMGCNWAIADVASRLSDEAERRAAMAIARERDWRHSRLPRALRPLAVLHGLARRAIVRGEGLDAVSPTALLPAMRIGLLGF